MGPAIRRLVFTRDPENVGANLGRLASFDVAGFVIGPLLAAVTADLFGVRAPFWILSVVFVGTLHSPFVSTSPWGAPPVSGGCCASSCGFPPCSRRSPSRSPST